MKALTKTLVLIFVVCIVASCRFETPERGNGNIVTEDFEVKGFKEVELSGNFEVMLYKSNKPSLEVVTDENLLDFIEVESDGDVLGIGTSKSIMSKEGVKLNIGYNDLSLVDIQGAVQLKSDGVYSGEFLSINMSGAGAVDMAVDLTALKVTVSGAGAVQLRGKVKEQNISMSGAGGYDAFDLISNICKVEISGVGGARVNVIDDLEASVSGVGGVTYRGEPSVDKSISGLGKVSQDSDD